MRTAKKLAKTNLSFNLFLGPPPLPPLAPFPPKKIRDEKSFLFSPSHHQAIYANLAGDKKKGKGGYQGFSSLQPIPYLILGCITLVVVVVVGGISA